MKARRKTPPRIPVEEFSVEYGDVNGVPLKEKKSLWRRKMQTEK